MYYLCQHSPPRSYGGVVYKKSIHITMKKSSPE